MQAFTLLLVLAAIVAAYRVYLTVKAMRRRGGGGSDDWDERLVKNLRAQGGDPFANHEVDFFFDLPTELACEQVATTLRGQGFEVDYKAQDPALGTSFSLHAVKSVRISVPDMQGHTQAFKALATQHAGRYDGWATAGMTRETLKPGAPQR